MTAQHFLRVGAASSPLDWQWQLTDERHILAREWIHIPKQSMLAKSLAGDELALMNSEDVLIETQEHVVDPLADHLMRLGKSILTIVVPDYFQSLAHIPFDTAVNGLPASRKNYNLATVFQLGIESPPLPQRRDVSALFGIYSSPNDLHQLDLRTELLSYAGTLQHVGLKFGAVQYGVTPELLRSRLSELTEPFVLHISGHGSAGVVALEDSDGRAVDVELADIAGWLPSNNVLALLVVLTCDSLLENLLQEVHATQIADPVQFIKQTTDPDGVTQPAPGFGLARVLDVPVVGCRAPVSDRYATRFASELYRALFVDGKPLAWAVKTAGDHADGATAGNFYRPSLFLSSSPTALDTLRVRDSSESSSARLPEQEQIFISPGEPLRLVLKLARHGGRLIQLLGAPGQGKTTVAKAVAAQLRLEDFSVRYIHYGSQDLARSLSGLNGRPPSAAWWAVVVDIAELSDQDMTLLTRQWKAATTQDARGSLILVRNREWTPDQTLELPYDVVRLTQWTPEGMLQLIPFPLDPSRKDPRTVAEAVGSYIDFSFLCPVLAKPVAALCLADPEAAVLTSSGLADFGSRWAELMDTAVALGKTDIVDVLTSLESYVRQLFDSLGDDARLLLVLLAASLDSQTVSTASNLIEATGSTSGSEVGLANAIDRLAHAGLIESSADGELVVPEVVRQVVLSRIASHSDVVDCLRVHFNQLRHLVDKALEVPAITSQFAVFALELGEWSELSRMAKAIDRYPGQMVTDSLRALLRAARARGADLSCIELLAEVVERRAVANDHELTEIEGSSQESVRRSLHAGFIPQEDVLATIDQSSATGQAELARVRLLQGNSPQSVLDELVSRLETSSLEPVERQQLLEVAGDAALRAGNFAAGQDFLRQQADFFLTHRLATIDWHRRLLVLARNLLKARETEVARSLIAEAQLIRGNIDDEWADSILLPACTAQLAIVTGDFEAADIEVRRLVFNVLRWSPMILSNVIDDVRLIIPVIYGGAMQDLNLKYRTLLIVAATATASGPHPAGSPVSTFLSEVSSLAASFGTVSPEELTSNA